MPQGRVDAALWQGDKAIARTLIPYIYVQSLVCVCVCMCILKMIAMRATTKANMRRKKTDENGNAA